MIPFDMLGQIFIQIFVWTLWTIELPWFSRNSTARIFQPGLQIDLFFEIVLKRVRVNFFLIFGFLCKKMVVQLIWDRFTIIICSLHTNEKRGGKNTGLPSFFLRQKVLFILFPFPILLLSYHCENRTLTRFWSKNTKSIFQEVEN